MATLDPRPGCQLLDVAGGTGDIAFRFLEYVRAGAHPTAISRPTPTPASSVVVCDINQSMLDVGRQRAVERGFHVVSAQELVRVIPVSGAVQIVNQGKETVADATIVSSSASFSSTRATTESGAAAAGSTSSSRSTNIAFIAGDAQQLPFADATFDAYTISFGLRNVTDIDAALREAFRVLRHGGRFMCLEFSQVENAVLRQIYDAYSFGVIPSMGEIVAQDRASYQYLVESIRKFPPQAELTEKLAQAGFRHCTHTNLIGGIAAIHSAFKITGHS